jgi:hypothetical protein
MEDLGVWKEVFNTVGPWGVLGVFLWRLLVWFKPWGEQLIREHILLVTELRGGIAKQSESDALTHQKLDILIGQTKP